MLAEGTMRTERINHTLVCVPNIFRPEENGALLPALATHTSLQMALKRRSSCCGATMSETSVPCQT